MTGYDYGNARLRARRAGLLRREQYAALAGRELPGLLAALAASGYQAQAEHAASTRPLRLVERLVRERLAAALGDVAGFYRDQAATVVATIFGRFDVPNVLAVLRAAHQGGTAGLDGAALLPGGRLDVRTAREAASQPELPAAARLLAGRRLPDPDSAAVLLTASRHYQVDTSLAAVEHAVAWAGRAHQARVLAAAGPAAEPVTAVLWRETDDQNLLLALRLREAGQPPGVASGSGPGGGRFLPGGIVPDSQLGAIAGALARGDAVAVAEAGPAAARWGPALTAWADTGDLAALHDRLDAERLREDLRLLRAADPLGPAAVLYHVLAHQAQARNIRLLAQAAAGTISHDAARRQLIEPG